MKVAVIGAGTMGSGIGQVFAQSREVECVYLCDISQELADKAKEVVKKNLKKLIRKDKLTEIEAENIQQKIRTGTKEIVGDADLVIEAVAEDLSIKRQMFEGLENICKESAIFATNTSSLSVAAIGAELRHPVVGMHFFNPVPVMKLVEISAGLHVSDDILEYIMDICSMIGKIPVKVEETPGFVVNRILVPMINEAVILYSEGVASVEDIDTAMKLGTGQPMGPLELGDLIGLDVILAIMEVLQKETGDPKYRPSMLLRKMIRRGKLGRKTGEGFYKYPLGDKE